MAALGSDQWAASYGDVGQPRTSLSNAAKLGPFFTGWAARAAQPPIFLSYLLQRKINGMQLLFLL